jgi:hypothetical protein
MVGRESGEGGALVGSFANWDVNRNSDSTQASLVWEKTRVKERFVIGGVWKKICK